MPETVAGKNSVAEPKTPDTASAPRVAPVRGGRRRAWRILIRSMVALVAVVVIVAAGLYAVVNHLESNIQRIKVTLAAAPQDSKRLNVLITSTQVGPTGLSGRAKTPTGLIMVMHLNADGQTGGVVSIPPGTFVPVPGHGTIAIQNAIVAGGPSLLVRTVTKLTGVPINRFARVDFNHLVSLVNVVGGVDVTIRKSFTAYVHKFPAGVNHLGGVNALYYARDPAVTEQTRVLRQQNLLRGAINKIVNGRMLSNPITTINILNALTHALTVDSNFSNSQLVALAGSLKTVTSNKGAFITAPTTIVNGRQVLDTAISGQLWSAVNHDSITAFGKNNPSTVTPTTVP